MKCGISGNTKSAGYHTASGDSAILRLNIMQAVGQVPDKARKDKSDKRSLSEQAVRKVTRHLIWFLVLLYIFAFLDRINIGFAALAMNKDLGLTATMFGLANTLLYLAYFFCSVPSNHMLAKYGASTWIPIILVGWGIASTTTMFAAGPGSLYSIRAVVGMFEAGFVPGIFLYLTLWFPQQHRARANALFMLAMPITMALGSPVSGAIMDAKPVFGVASWRLLFLLEGIPTIILGIIAAFYLTDRPANASWLSADEKQALEQRLDRDNASAKSTSSGGIWKEVFSPAMIILGAVYFGLTMTMNTSATWTPTIVHEMMTGRNFTSVGLIAAIPAVFTAIAMPFWSASSDHRNERIAHMVLPMMISAAGWLVVALSTAPDIKMIGLTLATVGSFSTMAIFWTLPPKVLSPAARPAGMAVMSSCGILASALAPLMVGFFRDLTHSFVGILIFEAGVLVASAALMFLVPRKPVPAMAG